MYICTYVQIVLDSIAALARKEGLNEVDKEQFIIGQVSVYSVLYHIMCLAVAVAVALDVTVKGIEIAVEYIRIYV